MRRSSSLLAILFLVASCSSKPSDQPELVPVSGVVTLDGQPVEGARIGFQPIDGRRGSGGLTDAYGRYELYYVQAKGCPLGDCTVSISTFGDVLDEYGGVAGIKKETIPAPYRGQNSTLKANVTADGENTFDFALASSEGSTDFDDVAVQKSRRK